MNLKTVFGKIWLVWAGICFGGVFLVLYPLFFIWLSHPKLYRIAHFQRRVWGVLASITTLYLPIVKRDGKIPKGRRIIYCSNHVSYLDILTTGTYLHGFNFFMAKMELAKIPLFKMWFRSLDVPVHREKLRASHAAFIQAGKQFDSGIDIIIFPEGKISDDTPILHNFKNGAFKLAIEKNALIVPVTLPYNHLRLDIHKWIAMPGIMRMHIHRPIDTAQLNEDDADTLKNQVFAIIENKLKAFGTIK